MICHNSFHSRNDDIVRRQLVLYILLRHCYFRLTPSRTLQGIRFAQHLEKRIMIGPVNGREKQALPTMWYLSRVLAWYLVGAEP